MKHLPLKENTAPKVNKPTMAKSILDNAKAKLRSYICSTAGYLYRDIFGDNPNYAEDEVCSIPVEDIFYLNVEVDNTYDENIVINRVRIVNISCFLDDTFTVRDEDGNEWDDCDLSVEAFAEISDYLELTYRHRTNSK